MATRFPAIEVIRKSGKECFQGMDGEHTLPGFLGVGLFGFGQQYGARQTGGIHRRNGYGL